MVEAGKAWADLVIFQDLESKFDSSSVGISGDMVDRGSESFCATKFPSTPLNDVKDMGRNIREEPVRKGVFDSADTKDVETFGLLGTFRKRKIPAQKPSYHWKNRDGRSRRFPSNYTSMAGSRDPTTDSNATAPTRKRSNLLPEGKVPKCLLTADYDAQSLFSTVIPPGATSEELIQLMAKALGEKEPKIIEKVIGYVGVDKSLALFEQCRQVEKNGGMMVNAGHRRRTPGGVFLQLFKFDKTISEESKASLFQFTRDLQLSRGNDSCAIRADHSVKQEDIQAKEELPKINWSWN